jgi:hypothetical protein
VVALAACGSDSPAAVAQGQPAPSISFAAMESPSMQFLPRQEEVPGWRLVEDPLVYPGDKLTRYLDADARHFRAYEVVDVTVGEYQRVGGEGAAIVEIFRFPDFVKAFGAYSTRRRRDAQLLEIENEGFLGPNSIHIWRGPFYFRILGSGTSNLSESLTQLATTIAREMPAAPGKPAVFSFFPTAQRLLNSEIYSAEPAFGQPLFANSFLATFQVNGQPIDGLIVAAPSKEASTRILDQYENFFRINGRVLDPIPNLGEDNFTAEDRFVGRVVALRLDRFVIVFRGYGPMQQLNALAIATGQRILANIRQQLEAADQAAAQAQQRGAER